MAHALADSGARILVLERGDFVPQEEENWNPEAVWKHLRYRADGALARRPTASEFLPYTHYGVGGNTKFWGSVLYRLRREDFAGRRARRRRLAGLADRLRHARAVLRPRRAALSRARRSTASIRPSRRAGRFRTRRFRTRAGDGGDRRRAAAPGPASLAAAARSDPAGRGRRLLLCNTCNSFPCRIHAKSDAEVCGVRPALAHAERRRCGPTRARAPRSPIRPAASVEAVEVERDGETHPRRRADSVVVSCGAVNSAALLLRSANDAHPRRPRELVGARRPPLHGASGDDDAGVPSVAEERHGVSEDRRDQRFLPARARTRRIRSDRSSRRAARTA